MAYTSRQELIEWMQLPADSQLNAAELHARSEVLDRALATARELIDSFCRRSFMKPDMDETRRFHPPYGAAKFNAGDLLTATSVFDDGIEIPLGTGYNIVPYTPGRPAAKLVRAEPNVWNGPVDVSGGWGWPAVPSAIKQAELKIAQKVYLSSRSTGGVIVVQDTTVDIKMFDADAYRLLNPFRVSLP